MRKMGKSRAKAGIIAGLERKIFDLQMKCSSLAGENHRLKKELEKRKEKRTEKELWEESAAWRIKKIAEALDELAGATPYAKGQWQEVFGEVVADEDRPD